VSGAFWGSDEIEQEASPEQQEAHRQLLEDMNSELESQVRQTWATTTAQYSTGWYGMVWYGMVWYGTVRYSTVQYSTALCSTIQYSTVEYMGQSAVAPQSFRLVLWAVHLPSKATGQAVGGLDTALVQYQVVDKGAT
jgi:hypothetical protein